MALTTYTELQTTVANWLNRGDLTATIPDFVVLVESRLRRVLRTKNITFVDDFDVNDPSEDLSAGIKEIRALSINGHGPVDPVSPAQLLHMRVRYPVADVPRYVAVINDVLHFAPEPDAAYTATIVYEPDIDPLATAAGGINWLLTNHPDIYLYGCLVEASPFLRDDPRVPMFEARFSAAVAELEQARDRYEYPNTPVARVENPAP